MGLVLVALDQQVGGRDAHRELGPAHRSSGYVERRQALLAQQLEPQPVAAEAVQLAAQDDLAVVEVVAGHDAQRCLRSIVSRRP